MFKDDLYVALKCHSLLLLLSEQKYDSLLFLAVVPLGGVGELLTDVQASTRVDFEERHASTTRHVRDLHKLYPS